MTETRAVCLNCIDGRVQLPVIHWIKQEFKADHVDMITEPGVDGLLADNNCPIDEIVRKIGISVEKNNANMIFVVGHHDCKGNPADELTHKEHIHSAVDRLKKEFTEIAVTGLWVNAQWAVEKLVEGNDLP